MKKLILLLVILFGYSCSPTLFISPTINLPLYSKSNNAKELILLKYGKPSKVENQVKQEIWIYDYSSSFKSNRTVIFDNNGKIVINKKHYKTFHMLTGLNKHGYIAIGAILLIYAITGPFPALL